MHGRGYTSCLLCEREGGLILGNELVQKIIALHFDGDDFDIMLEATKICIKCIGRLQQLNDFCVFVKSGCLKEPDEEESDKKLCIMCKSSCNDYEITPQQDNANLFDEIKRSNLLKDVNNIQEVFCCFACCNFIFAYNETKELFEKLNEYFYSTLTNCSISLKDCSRENADDEFADVSNIKQEEFFDFLELAPSLSSSGKKSVDSQRKVRFLNELTIISYDNDELSPEETEKSPRSKQVKPKSPPKLTKRSTQNLYAELLAKFNILDCAVHLERLNVNTTDDNHNSPRKRRANVQRKLNVNNEAPKKVSPKKPKQKVTKIKLNVKSKAIKRKPKSSVKSKKKQIKKLAAEKIPEPPVLVCESNSAESLQTSQSNINVKDPLSTFGNQEVVCTVVLSTNQQSSESTISNLDDNENIDNSKLMAVDAKKTNKKRASDSAVFQKRKTRSSDRNLRETSSMTNIPAVTAVKNPPLKINKQAANHVAIRKITPTKRKLLSSKKNESEKRQKDVQNGIVDENIDDNVDPQISSETKESEVNSEASSYLNESTEIEFLNPKFKNRAVKFQHSTVYEELDMIFSDEVNSVPDSDLNNLELNNAEYLDEAETLEDLLNTRPSQSQNDLNCPIYSMDELRNEDSLLNVS